MKMRDLRGFSSMLVVGVVLAWGGRAVADVWTVAGESCRIVSTGNPGEWDCPLPNHTPAFPFSGVYQVWFDGSFNRYCAANMTLSVVKVSYTGTVSSDQTTFSTMGQFDTNVTPSQTQLNPSEWDYVYAMFSTWGDPQSVNCRNGITADVYGVSTVR